MGYFHERKDLWAQVRNLKKEMIKFYKCSPGGRGEISILDQSCQALEAPKPHLLTVSVKKYSLLLLIVGFSLKPYDVWS